MVSFSTKKFERITKAIDWSNRELDFQRRKRIEAIEQFVGYHQYKHGAQKRQPVPLLSLAVMTYVRRLIARAPRAMVSVDRLDLKPVAANFELALNQIPAEIKLGDTLRRMVTEALFSIGIVKVGLHTVGDLLGHAYGRPFVDLVTIDDYFCDMSAKHPDQFEFEGNDFWLPFDEVMDSGWIKGKDRGRLKADDYTMIGDRGQKRAESVSTSTTPEMYRDKLWLRDVWIPSDNIVLTYAVTSKRIVHEVDWEGPERGPYPKLTFSHAPSQLMPLPPVSLWRDLDELANRIFRKLADQADAQKTVLGFRGDDEGVGSFKDAKDGDGIKYTSTKPEKLQAGGVDAKTLAFWLQSKDLFSYFAGNLDSLGGLSAISETATQDKLIGEAASVQIEDMADATAETTKEIFSSLAYYDYHDPVLRRKFQKPIPGTDLSVPVEFGPESKTADFDLYSITIDVYSFQDNSPSTMLRKLSAIMQTYVLPLAPLIERAGGTIDVEAILGIVARYADFPELAEIVTFVQADTPAAPDAGGMPAQTERRYVREGRPGAPPEGGGGSLQQQILSQALSGAGGE